MGQMTLSGSWSASIQLLPSVSLAENELNLNVSLAGWKLGETAEFLGADGYVWQSFLAEGALGPVAGKYELLFGPKAPAFLYLWGQSEIAIRGYDVILYSGFVGPTIPGYFFSGGPSGGMVAAVEQEIQGMKIRLETGLGARLTDFTIAYTGISTYTKIFPVSPFPGGLQFTYLELDITGIPFCCGISLDSEFSFTKAGFEALSFTLKDIALCCGISFDTKITFTTSSKALEVIPHWAGIEGCLTVYGDVEYAAGEFGGLEIYGFRVRCDIADCNYLEILHALSPDLFYLVNGELLVNPDPIPTTAVPLFEDDEIQYIKLGFCGPACCGGQYTLGLTAYFQPMGSLFGLRRIAVAAEVPLMASLEGQLELGVTVGGPVNLALGWTFTF